MESAASSTSTFTEIEASLYRIDAVPREHMLVCQCRFDAGGCGDRCLNRLMLIECDPSTCPCGESCQNSAFRRREPSSRIEVFDAGDKGQGIRALESLNRYAISAIHLI
jgi:hypothetical protein